jgi:dolichol kinase
MKGDTMNHTPDPAAAGPGGTFDAEQAATLLDHTTRQARRQFQPSPPWLLATRAVMVLAALGAIWLSVRGQHPYRGPTAADIPVLIAFIVLNFTATVGVRRHAIAGVSGRSRFSQGEIIALVLAFLVAVLLMVGLDGSGVSFAAYPTSVLVVPGLVWAIISAMRANRRGLATGLAIIVIGVVGAFAGPAGSWAVAAVGLCITLLGDAAAAWRQRG